MPTADTFTALGAGNGFSTFFRKIDVSFTSATGSYTHWVTLGGLKKTDNRSPTSQELSLSLENAVKLFWSLNGATLEGSRVTTGTNPPPSDYALITIDGSTDTDNFPAPSGDDQTKIRWANIKGDPETKENIEPEERVCYNGAIITKNKYDSNNYVLNYYLTLRIGKTQSSSGIFRMYDGDVDDESNFLGYGANLANGGGTAYVDEPNMYLNSAVFTSTNDNTEFTTGYIDSFCGMPFVYRFGAEYSDPDNHTISSTSTSITGTDAVVYTSGSTETQVVTISDLDFYTYS